MSDWRDFLVENPGTTDESEQDPEHAQNLARFQVNLQVTHEPGSPPPVVYETNPTYPNLFGYLERRMKYGALLTDYTRVRPGAFHRAAGGVLVVRATDLMTDPIIWERTKRILRERQIAPEDPLGPLGLYATTVRPKPMPVPLRMIVVGTSENYSILLDADPDFAALFRVKVEIESSVPRTDESIVALDAQIMKMAKARNWGTFTRGARAKLIDIAMRLAGDQERLSIMLGPVEETAAFASALAAARGLEMKANDDHAGDKGVPSLRRPFRASQIPSPDHPVTEEEVLLAWRERRERTGAAERQFRDLILRGEISVETAGSRVGVINGLSLLIMGDVEFGQPMRISAVVALGREGLVDVEREAQLSGAIHTKGVAILRGYLAGMFGQERPVSLRAQLAFEQSYGEIDGDSASCAELYALLSALADVGIDQGIAVTGSMNQLGAVQAVGGVCGKIEGFFDVCNARGLTGTQGVLIPKSNLPHTVLRDDVVAAVEKGLFHVYAVDNVAAGIEILTGLSAGTRDASGRFPASSIFGRVERRLIEIAERTRQAEGSPQAPAAHDSMEDVSVADLGGEDR
ncbi:MAG: AAA family ATPase [Polyangiaceae bacterium]